MEFYNLFQVFTLDTQVLSYSWCFCVRLFFTNRQGRQGELWIILWWKEVAQSQVNIFT